MKITKRQLRRIIKEERAKLMSEVKPADMSMHDAAEYYEQQRASGRDEPDEPLMDLDDYEALTKGVITPIRKSLSVGNTKEMVIQALKYIVEDEL